MVRRLLILTICLSFGLLKGQEENTTSFGVLPTDIPTQNLVKYNRFYFNPTFSLVRENKKSINVYSKIQWAGFNDNPQTYLINYTSNFDERMGVSIGLHQQNEGIYRFFGGTANYAYNVELDRDMNLTFGMNLSFSQSALKSNLDSATSTILNNGAEIDDPTILNYQSSSVFVLTPGVNFNYAEFDVGVSAVNLAAYNLSGSELLTDRMAINGHVMYTTNLERRSDKMIRGMGYATLLPDPGVDSGSESSSNLRYGANVILELPELGWAQAGYNSFYGVSVGLGGNINSNVSIGYTYEMGLGDTGDFGSTHEVGLAYNFEKERSRGRRRSSSKSSTQKAYEARDSEIRRLKKEILDQNKIIRELQQEQGESQSDAQRAMSELERSIAEAKEKEAQAARDLELQREEEVKLLNKQAEEEERLRAQMKLEAEMAERQAEEERLAAEKKLEQEIAEQEAAGQKTEEERIAAEEAIREAEAAKEQAEEEARIAAQKQQEIEAAEKQAEEARIAAQQEAERQAEEQRVAAQQEAERKAEEERLAAQREVERQEAERKAEAERLAAQREVERVEEQRREEEDRLKSEKILTSTKSLITEGNEAALRSQAELIRSSAFIPAEDKEKMLSDIDTAIAEKEAEAARLADEERQRQEAAEAARLAEEQRQAEEAQQAQELITNTRNVIANGTVNELRSQADIIQGSTILPQADKDGLLADLQAAIAAKEAEAARLAEEERQRQEAAEAARLAEEQRQAEEAQQVEELKTSTKTLITEGSEEALRSQAELIRSSAFIPAEDKEKMLADIDTAIAAKEAEAARLAEEERQRQEAAEAARLAEEQRKAEEARQIQELITNTRNVIANGTVNELRSQADIVRGSTILPQADKDGLLSDLQAAIAAKEAEAARLAEEERQRQEAAEAARLAEEQRKAEEARQIQELITNTRNVIANGTVNELRSQADIVRGSAILPQADKDGLLSDLQAAIAAKEAEAARLAEEERQRQEAAEAARLAEEERQRQEAEAAAAAAAAAAQQDKEEGIDELKKELDNNSRVSDKILARRDSLLTTSLNVDKREFSKLLESLVNMGDDAQDVKSSDPISSKRLTASNRFIKFAETTRPEAQIATKFIPGYEEGYYLIGNVFKGGEYANKFTSTLNDLGFNDSQIILNPENQFQYVAIESYQTKDEAVQKYLSSIDNRYYGDMWILHIAKSRVASYKKLLQETRLITDTVKDDTVLAETLSYIGGHNIENGYYLITNIFKRENYFERGMEKLKSQGLEPQYFRNPKDNYIYVYLKRFDNLDEAKQSLFSNVNNSYSGDLYILKIQ